LIKDSQYGLKRTLGLPHVVAVAIGQTIGAGIFVLTGMGIEFTGPSITLAFLVAAVPITFLLLVVAMLGSALPTTAGTYMYASRLFSPMGAFVSVWGYLAASLLGAFPLYAISAAHYVQAVVDVPTIPTALGLLTLLYVVNLLGISFAAIVQGLMVALLVISLVVFAILGFPHVEPANFTPFFTGGAGGFAMAAAILTFTLVGANAIIELGGEIKNPGKTIPRAFLIAFPVVLILYIFVAIIAAGVLPWTETAGQPLTVVAQSFMGQASFNFFVFGGGLLAIVTTLNASLMWGTRSLLGVGADGLLPQRLTSINKRFGTPHWFLTMIYLVSAAAIIVLGEDYLSLFAVLASIGGIMVFIPLLGAAAQLPKKAPEAYEKSPFKLRGIWLPVSIGIGFLLSLVILIILLVDLLSSTAGLIYGVVFILWLIAGAVLFLHKKPRQKGEFSKQI
jgi:APA family basic amino acid/polyamine antiporter